jgi:hypothetical protein
MSNENPTKRTRGNFPAEQPQATPVVPEIRLRQLDANPELDRDVVTDMILSDEFLEKLCPIYKLLERAGCSHRFLSSGLSRTVAGWCFEHYEKHREAPGPDIEIIFKKEIKALPEDEGKLLGMLLQSLADENERRKEYEFHVNSHFAWAKEHIKDCLKVAHVNDARRTVKTATAEAVAELDAQYQALLTAIDGMGQELPSLEGRGLEMKKIPQTKWVIPGMLPEGLSVLGGKPKKGKSILALNILLAITSEAPIFEGMEIEKGSAIYLALEDVPRRLKDRIAKMKGGAEWVGELTMFPQMTFPPMPEGLIRLENAIENHENKNLRLVVVDTWGRFKAPESGKRDPYEVSVEEFSKIKALADKHHVSILLILHMKKEKTEDIIDSFIGTIGRVGTADTLLGLVRKGQEPDATLHIEGRDVEPQDLAVQLDPATLTWKIMGKAKDFKLSTNRQAIVDAILTTGEPMTSGEIARAVKASGKDMSLASVEVTTNQMTKHRTLVRSGKQRHYFYDVSPDIKVRTTLRREKSRED